MTWVEIVTEIKKITGYAQRTGKSEVDIANMVINNAIYEHLKANSGLITDTAVTDPTASASIVAALKGLLKQLQGTGSGGTPITMARGTTTTVHSAIGPVITTGTSVIGSPIITNLTGHAFKAGDTLTVASGFASTSQTIISVTSTTITVGNNANANVSGTVSITLLTSTGAEIDCTAGNSLSVECAVSAITSGNWMIEILGCAVTGGTFGECWDGSSRKSMVGGINANGNYTFLFKDIPNYVEIKATRTTDGTLTCNVTPENI